MKMVSAATKVAPDQSPSDGSFADLGKKFRKLHLFSVDRTNRWPIQGWSSGDDSHSSYELDEQFVADETTRPFTLDKEARWPLQGWCKAHKPYRSSPDNLDSAVATSTKPSVPSRWPQGW